MTRWDTWKQKAAQYRLEVHAIYFACRDPRAKWYVKVVALGVVGYAFSPIDLIPDPIPVLGYLDDLLLIPLGVWAVRAMIPPGIMVECRARAAAVGFRPRCKVAAGIIIALWLLVFGAVAAWTVRIGMK